MNPRTCGLSPSPSHRNDNSSIATDDIRGLIKSRDYVTYNARFIAPAVAEKAGVIKDI
jgi:hypothetical protein